MSGIGSLDGMNHAPWSIKPGGYDLLCYPSEWTFEGQFFDAKMRELSPIYYTRAYGPNKVVCLDTVYVKDSVSEWFSDDVVEGCHSLMTHSIDCSVCPSDSYARLQNATIKGIMERKVRIGQYTAIPCIPAELEIPRIYTMILAMPLEASAVIPDLKRLIR